MDKLDLPTTLLGKDVHTPGDAYEAPGPHPGFSWLSGRRVLVWGENRTQE